MRKSPRTRASICVRRKQSIASSGRQPIGSLSVKELLITTGTPVRSRRAEISAALKPAEIFPIGDYGGGTQRQLFFAQFGDGIATLRQSVRIDCAPDLFTRVSWSPVGVIHHEGARLTEFLMPDVVRGADRQATVYRRRMNVDLLERRRVKNFPVRDAIESYATGKAHR